jgi:hypothetical protein
VFALTCALASASSTAYYRYFVSRAWLAVRGLLPWSLLSLLEDGHQLGVLRTVGAVYQFRHASLQERLAGEQDVRPVVRQPTDTVAEEAISALKTRSSTPHSNAPTSKRWSTPRGSPP